MQEVIYHISNFGALPYLADTLLLRVSFLNRVLLQNYSVTGRTKTQ
jgi:hypothetical protein